MIKSRAMPFEAKNGDKGRTCETKDCSQRAYQLSATKKRIGNITKNVQRYELTIRYKCLSGHRFDRLINIKENILNGKKYE